MSVHGPKCICTSGNRFAGLLQWCTDQSELLNPSRLILDPAVHCHLHKCDMFWLFNIPSLMSLCKEVSFGSH